MKAKEGAIIRHAEVLPGCVGNLPRRRTNIIPLVVADKFDSPYLMKLQGEQSVISKNPLHADGARQVL